MYEAVVLLQEAVATMQLDQQKACFGWLLDSVPVKLLWRSALDDAARKAAAEGRIDVLTYMLEAVHVPKGERRLAEKAYIVCFIVHLFESLSEGISQV